MYHLNENQLCVEKFNNSGMQEMSKAEISQVSGGVAFLVAAAGYALFASGFGVGWLIGSSLK